MLLLRLLAFLGYSVDDGRDHIYSHVPLQNCPALDNMEFTSTYVDGFCKIYLPREAFVGGDMRVTIRALDLPDSADTTEQVLSNDLTPALFPVYSYSAYTFSPVDSSCPASAEQTLLCLPPAERTTVLSTEAIATLYVLYDAKIREALRASLSVHPKTGAPEHILGFFDGVFPEHGVLSTLLSHALSSQFGWPNLALVRFLQSEPATTGYWAGALSKVDEFDTVAGLFSAAYTATLRRRESGDGSFRLVLVVAEKGGDVVINMESQPYRPFHLVPMNQANVHFKNTETLSAGTDVYLQQRPGLAVIFSYFSQPGRGSSRGASCLDYMDVLGQQCTSYSSGQNLCPVQSSISKGDLLDAIAERPIYLSTAGGEEGWMKLFTLEPGEIINICGYWMTDQPATAQETDGAIYFANKDRPSPLAFFLLITVGGSFICVCILVALLIIMSFCTCLRLHAVDLHWSPHKTPLPENPKEAEEQELQAVKTEANISNACISPLLSKAMSPLLLPRGDAAKKLLFKQRRHKILSLAVAENAAKFSFSEQELSNVTKDTVHSIMSTNTMVSSSMCLQSADMAATCSEDRRGTDALTELGSLEQSI